MQEYHNDWHTQSLWRMFLITLFSCSAVCEMFWSHIGSRVRSVTTACMVWECFAVCSCAWKNWHLVPCHQLEMWTGNVQLLKVVQRIWWGISCLWRSPYVRYSCMFWRWLGFLGFLKVLRRNECSRLVSGKSWTAQTKSQMHKYGKLLSLSKSEHS